MPERPIGNIRTRVKSREGAPRRHESDIRKNRGKLATILLVGVTAAFLAFYPRKNMDETGGKAEVTTPSQPTTEPKQPIAVPQVAKLEPEKPKENPVEKYFGKRSGGLKHGDSNELKTTFSVNFTKLNPDKSQPKVSKKLYGVDAGLVMPISVNADYNVQRIIWGKYRDLPGGSGTINQIGGIYDVNGEHCVVFWAPDLGTDIVAKIRDKNNRIQIYIPRAGNSKKIKSITNRWVYLR